MFNTDIRNFKSLLVWQLGIEIVENIYRLTATFPKNEMYGISGQMQRSSVSIPANIAEGHAKGFCKDYLRHLGISQGSVAELETLLIITQKIQIGEINLINSIIDKCIREAKMLRNLRKSVKRRIPTLKYRSSNPQSPVPNP
jgi:four helix bundle protein